MAHGAAGGRLSIGERRRRESGAVLIVAAGALLFCLAVAALAVDLGRIAWEKRQLRLQADLAALAASREVGACSHDASDPLGVAQANASANGYDGNLGAAPNQVALGRVESAGGLRSFVSAALPASADAVEVVAHRDVRRSWLIPGALPGELELRASAVARTLAVAGFSVGSRAAGVDDADADALDSILGGLLGGGVGVSALGYDGLLAAQVELGDLAQAVVGAGSVSELLAADVEVADFLEATAEALAAGGDSAAAATLAGIAAAAVPSGRSFTVGDILNVDEGSAAAALGARVNALDLLIASAQAANRDNAIAINPLWVGIPGVASAALTLAVIEPPQIAIGPPGQDENGSWRTEARTSQLRLQLDLQALSGLSLPLGIATPVRISVFYEVAPAAAHLTSIECARAADPTQRVGVEVEPGLFRYGAGAFADIESDPDALPMVVAQITFLGATVARIRASSESSAASAPEELFFDGPFPPEKTETAGTDLGSAAQNAQAEVVDSTDYEVEVLGVIPGGINSAALEAAVAAILDPVLTNADDVLAGVLLSLGGNAGSADVTVFTAEQSPPELLL